MCWCRRAAVRWSVTNRCRSYASNGATVRPHPSRWIISTVYACAPSAAPRPMPSLRRIPGEPATRRLRQAISRTSSRDSTGEFRGRGADPDTSRERSRSSNSAFCGSERQPHQRLRPTTRRQRASSRPCSGHAAQQHPPCADPGAVTNYGDGPQSVPDLPAPPGTARVIQIALNQVGKPYIWGAKGPNAFDCSGLTEWSYAQIGIDIPTGTSGQWPGLPAPTGGSLAFGRSPVLRYHRQRRSPKLRMLDWSATSMVMAIGTWCMPPVLSTACASTRTCSADRTTGAATWAHGRCARFGDALWCIQTFLLHRDAWYIGQASCYS